MGKAKARHAGHLNTRRMTKPHSMMKPSSPAMKIISCSFVRPERRRFSNEAPPIPITMGVT